MNRMRQSYSKWSEIAAEIGFSSFWCRKIFEDSGYADVNTNGSHISTVVRNARILEIANYNYDKKIRVSDLGLADLMKAEGFLSVTRQVVAGVLFRARKAGVRCPPANDVPKSWKSAQNRSNSAYSPFGFVPQGLELQPIPPRTPELLAKGKVSWDDLKPSMCRYTPNEDAPFFFCGEAVIARSSWCQDCYDRIIKRTPEETATARRNNALRLEQRAKH
jgi:hypothetical protein